MTIPYSSMIEHEEYPSILLGMPTRNEVLVLVAGVIQSRTKNSQHVLTMGEEHHCFMEN
jgi:hypothetical protein